MGTKGRWRTTPEFAADWKRNTQTDPFHEPKGRCRPLILFFRSPRYFSARVLLVVSLRSGSGKPTLERQLRTTCTRRKNKIIARKTRLWELQNSVPVPTQSHCSSNMSLGHSPRHWSSSSTLRGQVQGVITPLHTWYKPERRSPKNTPPHSGFCAGGGMSNHSRGLDLGSES